MKVDFLIIGAQKGGSTWLYNNLRQHPGIYTPTHELHFFSSDVNYGKGTDWYHAQMRVSGGKKLVGEKTPEYMTVIPTSNPRTSVQTAKRIYDYNKEIKLLVVLREPVSRLVSAINHMYRTGRIAPWVTPYDLVLGEEKDAGNAFSILENGLYYENLRKYYELFPAERIKVIYFESDIIKRPYETLESVCAFLGVPFDKSFFFEAEKKKNEFQMSYIALWLNHYFPKLRAVNNRLNHIFPRHKAKIDSTTKAFLQDYYLKANLELRELVGSVPENWLYKRASA